jgi:hypothetical protein
MQGDLSVFFYFLRRKLCEKSLNKIKSQSPWENKVDTYGATLFAPDYSANVLAAKMCTNSHKHSIYIRFICPKKILKNRHLPFPDSR